MEKYCQQPLMVKTGARFENHKQWPIIKKCKHKCQAFQCVIFHVILFNARCIDIVHVINKSNVLDLRGKTGFYQYTNYKYVQKYLC